MWNQRKCECMCNKAPKIDQSLDIKHCSRKKQLFGTPVLTCEDQTLNTTETHLMIKRCNMWKRSLSYSHYFIGNYLLIISRFY